MRGAIPAGLPMRGLAFAVVLLAAQDPTPWVEFQSREADKPPRLVIDGKERTAAADALLISYLPDRAFGTMKGLAVSLGDTNRVLIRFDLDGAVAAKKAELVLALTPSRMPPTEAFDLGVYSVTADWDENGTPWSTQPEFEKEPAATVSIAPKADEVRIDVTALVNRWIAKKTANHGVLLKVTKPVGGGDADAARAAERALRKMLPWEKSIEAAQAKGGDKLVLAVVFAEDDPARMPLPESVMLASMAHPEILSLIRDRYLPVRVVVGAVPDAKVLGVVVKAPALVVSDGSSLSSIGTFDVDLFLDFLRKPLKEPTKGAAPMKGAALVRQGKFAEARAALAGVDGPEALYLIGCLEWRDREPAKARAAWESIVKKHADSPWALRAMARLAWPERMAMYESLAAAEPGTGTTERVAKDLKRAAERGADYLVEQQSRDGSWALPEAEAEMYRAAVTALAAQALFEWRDAFDDARKARVKAAVSKATDWMQAYIAKENPETANSWGAAYLVDYFLERHGADKTFRRPVEKSVALLLGGQMPNGAWSYSRQFGVGWKGGFGGWPKTDKGRAHSMNTGPALVALGGAKKAGFEVDAKALAKGIDALKSMRKAPAVYTYTWPDPDCFSELDQSIGRASSCEHALLLAGAAEAKDADAAIEAFMKWRADLRIPVKLTPGWIAPRHTSSYFYFFAYWHAARLIVERGGDGAAKRLQSLRDDLLAVVEADGTWVDFQNVGKPYATAMAMMVIRAAEAP